MAPTKKPQKEAVAATVNEETKLNDTLSDMLSGKLTDYIYIDKEKKVAFISIPFNGYIQPKIGKKMTLINSGKGGFRTIQNNDKKDLKANFLIGHY